MSIVRTPARDARPAAPNTGGPWARLDDPRLKNLVDLIRSRHSLIHIASTEEERVRDFLAGVGRMMAATGTERKVRTWTVTQGLQDYKKASGGRTDEQSSPDQALRQVLETDPHAGLIFVFHDFGPFLGNAEIVRLLRDCASELRKGTNVLILLGPRIEVPESLVDDLVVFDYPLPSELELRRVVDGVVRKLEDNPHVQVDLDPADKEALVRALRGLTEVRAKDALGKAAIENGGLNRDAIGSVIATKRDAIRRSGALEAIAIDSGMDSVGGLDVLKAWIRKRKNTFSEAARDFGIEPPKGILTLGVPGGGKGISARAVASEWQIPLLRLDFGALFGSLVGESEQNIREALKIAEALAPVVLWVDEIEKALSGVGGGDTDGGTTRRVFGTFLTWLQEKKAPVVCYFTANDISSLPPELTRKGRVDELFFIDLPNRRERAEILEIHLRKRARDPQQFDIRMLADECDTYVGAEIEQAVKEALVDAFSQGREVQTGDILKAFQATVPMAKQQEEKLARIREWVEEGRAVNASSVTTAEDSLFEALGQPAADDGLPF